MGGIHSFIAILNIILLFAQMKTISAQVERRLPTPEEGCGFSTVANTKIVGGTEAKPGAYPWMLIIGYIDFFGDKVFKCDGTLITSRHVLTAAHCVTPDIAFVRLGVHNLANPSEGHQDIKVIKSVAHSNFSEGQRINDIAILTLERDVEFTDRIRPICLPWTEELKSNSFVDTNPFVAGWGALGEDDLSSDLLMQVQVPVVDNKKCEALYKRQNLIFSKTQFDNGVICAGKLTGGENTCHGDSGGPMMLPILEKGQFPMYQIGVIAYSFGCARPNKPTVFTRVTHYMDWILENIN